MKKTKNNQDFVDLTKKANVLAVKADWNALMRLAISHDLPGVGNAAIAVLAEIALGYEIAEYFLGLPFEDEDFDYRPLWMIEDAVASEGVDGVQPERAALLVFERINWTKGKQNV